MLKATKKAPAPTPNSVSAVEMYRSKLKIKSNENGEQRNDSSADADPPLKQFSLRGNQLCGSILIGNYNYLTQLEVSENDMEVLDLSSLAQLETLKCSWNKLMELMINGKNLMSITADHNNLHTITVSPVPSKLTQLNISHNSFSELPSWTGYCASLLTLQADHNRMRSVSNFLATYKISGLRSLQLGYNQIRALSRLPDKFSSVEQLQLQSNELQSLPENFFMVTHRNLISLNLSCNKLFELAKCGGSAGCKLEELLLSSNSLNERIFDVLQHANKLRVLHAAYNKISELPVKCINSWPELEVLVLSGNMLQHLPDNVSSLAKLQVLRVHSNLLLSTPKLSLLGSLKVLDLAHNHLDHVNLLSIVPKNLKHLDLSCNLQLQVDEKQLKVCQGQRNWSLVDVSGKNRACLPTKKLNDLKDSKTIVRPPWSLGFSETNGKSRKLLASQLRLCNFRVDEALFGMFESKVASVAALVTLVPKILQQERTVKETVSDYLKYTLLAAQQQLMNGVASEGISATLCHVTKEYIRSRKCKRYVLRVASVGSIGACLIRKTVNVCLSSGACGQQLAAAHLGTKTLSFADPDLMEIILSNEDEYLVICNGHLWSVMDVDRVAREIRKEENVVLAAKRIQDIAQSFGADSSLSVIVVRFRNIGTDVEHLIKELKKSVRQKQALALPSVCKRTCCERSNVCGHRLPERPTARHLPTATRSDRSSPSGQSDRAANNLLRKDADGEEFVLSHAQVLEEENELDMLDETDSVLSEEQFKCWEYMLEQNTQLLFDKELNTISKSFTKNRNNANLSSDYKSNLLKNVSNKFISNSSPQLLHNDVKKTVPSLAWNHQHQLSFLSKHFGSSRSFQATHAPHAGYNFFDPKHRDSLAFGSHTKLGGGPNAAYFGSLQRLMPYNLEYDFAVTQERCLMDDEDDDFNEHENRMRKYWGVATTEL